MLYHVPDPALAVAELARVLRPDGVLVAAARGPGHLIELHEIEREVFGDAAGDGALVVHKEVGVLNCRDPLP
jgi:SAM-dependent methyltransferase